MLPFCNHLEIGTTEKNRVQRVLDAKKNNCNCLDGMHVCLEATVWDTEEREWNREKEQWIWYLNYVFP